MKKKEEVKEVTDNKYDTPSIYVVKVEAPISPDGNFNIGIDEKDYLH